MARFHISSSQTHQVGSLLRVQEIFEPITNVYLDSLGEAPMSLDMHVRVLPAIAVSVHTSTPLQGTRTQRQVVEDGSDDLAFCLSLSGSVLVQQKGRPELVLRPGAGVLWENDRPGQTRTQDVELVNVTLPRTVLASSVKDLDAALKSELGPSMSLSLLTAYAHTLASGAGEMTAEGEALAALHLRDLAAMALGPTSDAAEAARDRGVRAARLAAIKADITARLGDCDLSLETVARRHGISPRYVRALFDLEGTNFTDYVLNARLARAHRMLTDPRSATRSVTVVAYEVGFNDSSYFGRAFRRRYGMTPTDVRATLLANVG